MTFEEFINIRKNSGISLGQLSNIIRVHTRTIRRYEDGSVPISGPVSVLMEMIRDNKIHNN
jgi:predicted transcriptional regulator